MLRWIDNMNQMLAAFEQQVKFSLGQIELSLKRDGLFFDDEFKQYFMRASNSRIEESYDQFQIDFLMKNKVNDNVDSKMPSFDDLPMVSSSYSASNKQQGVNNTVELIDSSDDEGVRPGYRLRIELLEELAAIDNGDPETLELNDNDGSNTEIDNAMKTQQMEMNDRIPISKEHATTDSLNNKWNVVDDKNMIRNKNSLSANEMQMNKKFKCQYCQYSSNNKQHLMKHIRIHTGEKPYRCDICRKGFSQIHHMKIHKVTHTNEIPFHCRGCFTEFLQKAERKDHEKVCKKRRYECHLCKKVFNPKTHLKDHMTKHSGEKSFQCEICMRRFTIKSNLKRHLDNIHTRINTQID